jgi:uncharacterized Zn-finger protein
MHVMCNKSFSDQSLPRKHLHIHSRERPYACDVCKKSFSLQSSLRSHLRMHSGVRP